MRSALRVDSVRFTRRLFVSSKTHSMQNNKASTSTFDRCPCFNTRKSLKSTGEARGRTEMTTLSRMSCLSQELGATTGDC